MEMLGHLTVVVNDNNDLITKFSVYARNDLMTV